MVGTKVCLLIGAYLHLKSVFLTIIGCREVVPNVKIDDFLTLLHAEALLKVISAHHWRCR